MSNLIKLNNIRSLVEKIKSGQITSLELITEAVDSIDQDLNAYCLVLREQAMMQAKESDRKIKEGLGRPLEGIPVSVKDLYCTDGIETTAGSKILEGFVPSFNAHVLQKLLDSGCILIGKNNLDEFAMGSANITSKFGSVINPYRRKSQPDVPISAGGSSGGSAVAVATSSSCVSLGTDTGGSTRLPAAFCGIFGLRPSYGRLSRNGIIPLSSSFDQPGIFASSIQDMAVILDTCSGWDSNDSTSAKVSSTDSYQQVVCADRSMINGLKIAVFDHAKYGVKLDSDTEDITSNAVETISKLGATVGYTNIPLLDYGISAYYAVVCAEAASNLAKYDGIKFGKRVNSNSLMSLYEDTRGYGFGDEVKRRILLGTYVLNNTGYYDQAMRVREVVWRELQKVFEDYDLIIMPCTYGPAFSIAEASNLTAEEMYACDIFTMAASLAGCPAMSIPIGKTKESMPVGLQLIGKQFSEEKLLRSAEIIRLALDIPERCHVASL